MYHTFSRQKNAQSQPFQGKMGFVELNGQFAVWSKKFQIRHGGKKDI